MSEAKIMLPVFRLPAVTKEEWNATARVANSKAFLREHGRPPKDDTELYAWVYRYRDNKTEGVTKMNELIKINYDNDNPTISGRELHEALGVGTQYKDWFPRMCEYGFEEGADFSSFLSESTGGRPATDHRLTIPMAKEIAMLQRTEPGKQIRQYLIRLEDAWNTPEMVMSRALKMAESKIRALAVTNSRLSVDNQIMKPKADYFDELVDRNLLTNFRDTAKELGIGERLFIAFLLEKKYVYRDQRGKIQPYADKNNGLFEVKECFNEKTQWSGTQTLVTPKGRETFRLLYIKSA